MKTTEEEKRDRDRDRDTQKSENEEEELQKEKKEKNLEPELVQVPDPAPVGRPDMVYGSPPPDPMRHLDTPSRKRLRRSMPQDIPGLPPPNEEIVLKYFSSFHPIRKEKETEMKFAEEEATTTKVGGAFELGGGIQTCLLHQIKS